jgi:hypothetical protein
MFRWWVTVGQFDMDYLEPFNAGAAAGWTLQQYRDWFRKAMKAYYAQT